MQFLMGFPSTLSFHCHQLPLGMARQMLILGSGFV